MRRALLLVLAVAACATDPAGDDDDVPPTVATGELGPWTAAAPLPTARANHCTAAIGDTVLVIGGNRKQGDAFVKTDEIHAARISADGTLGPWQLAGRTPSPVSECTATADGRTLYVLDGLYDDEAHARTVFTATLDQTGQLGALVAMGALPQIAISSEAAVRGGALLMMDTVLPADGDATITLRTPLAGAVTWSTDDWGIGFRAQSEYAFTDGFAYTIGGYKGDAGAVGDDPRTGRPTDATGIIVRRASLRSAGAVGDDPRTGPTDAAGIIVRRASLRSAGNPVTAETFVAAIGAGGAIGPARPTTPLPAPTSHGEAVAVDDWVFVTGGRAQVFGSGGTTTVVAAQAGPDGSLGAWRTVAALPMPRTNHELALVGDFLVLTGGADTGPGDTTVLVARVRF